jgi:hypothetical protein
VPPRQIRRASTDHSGSGEEHLFFPGPIGLANDPSEEDNADPETREKWTSHERRSTASKNCETAPTVHVGDEIMGRAKPWPR